MTPLLAPRARHHRAFERMYQRHVGDVYRYALAVMRNQADAEDVTQTTFLNAYRAFERDGPPQRPHNWLIAIAHNVCRQRFRQSARRPVEVALNEDVGAQFVEPDEAPSGDDIRRALTHLAFNQRGALVAHPGPQREARHAQGEDKDQDARSCASLEPAPGGADPVPAPVRASD